VDVSGAVLATTLAKWISSQLRTIQNPLFYFG